MRHAQTNFLCRMTLAKTRAVSPGLGKGAEDRARDSCFQLGLVASAVLNEFSEPGCSEISELTRSRPRATGTMTLDGRNYRPPDCLRDASAQRLRHDTSLQIGVAPGTSALA
jgi:hypothetical protein